MTPKLVLTFDLEFWYNSEFLGPYLNNVADLPDLVIESTDPLLNFLKERNIRATFFILGQLAEKYPDLIKRIAAQGHGIASHGYSHTPISKLSKEEFENELSKTEEILIKITGIKPRSFRAPCFSLNSNDKWAFEILERRGYKFDSSIFSKKGPLYGEDLPSNASFLVGNLIEVPLPIYRGLVGIPIGGGFYFRFIPLWLFNKLFRRALSQDAGIIYLHPHELYGFVPTIKIPFYKRILKYWGVNSSFHKFQRFVSNFECVSMDELEKGRFDLHVHSCFSKDSFSSLNKIIKAAKKRGLRGVAITDHNNLKITEQINTRGELKDNLLLIAGEEVRTEKGDVIGLFLSKPISSKIFSETINEIKNQEGLVIIPHPFGRNSCFTEDDLLLADAIEIQNSRLGLERNKRAQAMALRLGKSVTAGSDAHSASEVGRSYVELQGTNWREIKASLLINANAYGKNHNYYLSHGRSFMIEKVKKIRKWF